MDMEFEGGKKNRSETNDEHWEGSLIAKKSGRRKKERRNR
jgi:hypothetical protein